MTAPGTRGSGDANPSPDHEYRERLTAPVWIWATCLALVAVLALALGVPLGPWVGFGTLLIAGIAVSLGLRATAGHVAVEGQTLTAGPARLPLSDAGAVVALDAEGARWLRGPGADGRAYLYLRGWIPTAVRVDVVDPNDPAPYWYVSTRQPIELAAAIEATRGEVNPPGSVSSDD